MPLWRDSIDAAAGPVAHAVAADARVVPVRHEHAAVRGDANVAHAEPRVLARDHDLLRRLVPGPLRLDVEAAQLARPGVAMQQLPAEALGQERPLVEADPRRAAEAGANDLVHDARLLLVPVAFTLAARVVAIVPARHHMADARLLVAVVVVVREPDL